MEGNRQLFSVDPTTNPECIVGGHIQKILDQTYQEAQNAAFGRLSRITLEDIINDILVAHTKEEKQQ